MTVCKTGADTASDITAHPDPLFATQNLSMSFGGITAVDKVSFSTHQREITAIIGPNGAGKTTLFNCLTGFYRPTAGHATLARDGRDHILSTLPAHRIARLGVARTFQNIRLFGAMTALENVLVGILPPFHLPFANTKTRHRTALDTARHWLDRLDLLACADTPAHHLSYGQQRRLEIARAMGTSPVLLCLDEPAAGLNPAEAATLRATLLRIRDDTGIGILLIEHNMNLVMGVSDRILVLDRGSVIAHDTPAAIKRHPAVIKAYLGEPDAAA